MQAASLLLVLMFSAADIVQHTRSLYPLDLPKAPSEIQVYEPPVPAELLPMPEPAVIVCFTALAVQAVPRIQLVWPWGM